MARKRVTVDFETFSELPMGKGKDNVGAWRYAQHHSTEILWLGYRIDRGPTKLWCPLFPFPQELLDAIEAGYEFVAHNAQFERAIWLFQLTRKLGIPMPKRWRDTMAACAHRGLPLGLDKVCDVLKLPIQKDKRGKELIRKLCKPRKPTKNNPATRLYDWELLDELGEYCITDVDAEEGLEDCIGDLPAPEQRIWVLDQKINQRGIRVDMEAVRKAKEVSDLIGNQLTGELIKITDGEVQTGRQIDKFKGWLLSNGVDMPNLQADTVTDMLDFLEEHEDIENPAYRGLKIRQQLSRASTGKLDKFMQCTSDDGILRGLLQYHGAGTGRWAGRGVQPQNFPRGSVGDYCKKLNMNEVEVTNLLIDTIKLGGWEAVETLEMLFDDPVEAIATALRGMFISKPGHRLMASDFASIEARVLMWLAQQTDALDAFAAYDRGEGPDIYCVMAQALYSRVISKKHDPEERQLGKITVLGCGYQMGAPKLKYQAKKDYGVIVTDETSQFLVNGYRSTYSNVPQLWKEIERAAILAVENPGKRFTCSYVAFETVDDRAGRWLTCILPNSRRLWYFNPIIVPTMTPWGDPTKKLTYEGRDNKKGGAWGRISTYGGMFVENIVQAIARDILVEAMVRVEVANYPIVLTVHDETISDVPNGFGTLDEFNHLMARPVPVWAPGCPIAVGGWEGPRFHKE